jgi:cytochrome P450
MTRQSSPERDYFTDPSVLKDPYDYFEEMYSKGPVHQLESRDIVMVTGFEESLEVLRNTDDFSSLITVPGAAVPLPFEPKGDDISEQIRAHRAEVRGSDLLVTYDDAQHTSNRSLLNRLFSPSRLKANEEYMSVLAEKFVRDAVAKGQCELINEIATPYVTLVVADLLGVPQEDRDLFRQAIDASPPAGNMYGGDNPTQVTPLEYMAGFFVRYLEERRATPKNDVLTELATVKYPDGSTPELLELVRLSTVLFGAGQDTSAKLISTSMRHIVETPDLQQRLRQNRELIPGFIDEVLRLEGSSKVTFRLARKKTRIGTMEIPAGKKIVVALAAANRDPRRWENPKELKLDRPKLKEHLAFGRGAHVCIGAPLARAEVRIILDRFLAHTSEITLSEDQHGKPGNRRLDYEPSFIIRGLVKLHIELKPS